MACPLCGDPCTCSHHGDSGAAGVLLAEIGAETSVQPSELSSDYLHGAAAPAFSWRQEVSSRVKAHRRRRGHDTEASLDLQFDPFESAPAHCANPAGDDAAAGNGATTVRRRGESSPSRYRRIAIKRAEAALENGNLIEFPRSSNMTYDLFAEALAEPVPSEPRILEAPEPANGAESAPVLAGMMLEAWPPFVDPFEEVRLELPLQVAPLATRFVSTLTDAVLVMTGVAVFSVVVMSMARFVPQGKMALAAGVALPLAMWAAYHLLFLVYGAATPGMRVAQLELTSFEGCLPARRARGWRALALLLSAGSLGLGFLWTALDEDSLGWHDRITRTYLRMN